MTPRERAAVISREFSIMAAPNGHHILKAVEQAINAAVEAEREECAKICDKEAAIEYDAAKWGQTVRASVCANKIRARSTASSVPQED